jgi:hypothetical protein
MGTVENIFETVDFASPAAVDEKKMHIGTAGT